MNLEEINNEIEEQIQVTDTAIQFYDKNFEEIVELSLPTIIQTKKDAQDILTPVNIVVDQIGLKIKMFEIHLKNSEEYKTQFKTVKDREEQVKLDLYPIKTKLYFLKEKRNQLSDIIGFYNSVINVELLILESQTKGE